MISTLLRLFGSVYDKDTRKGLFPHNLSLSLQDHPLTLLALLLAFSIYLDLILALALLAARCFSLRVLSLTGPRNPLSALCSPGQLYFRASGRSTHLSLLGLFTHLPLSCSVASCFPFLPYPLYRSCALPHEISRRTVKHVQHVQQDVLRELGDATRSQSSVLGWHVRVFVGEDGFIDPTERLWWKTYNHGKADMG